MNPEQDEGRVYLCPMHREVRQLDFGKCPKCGMDLLPEGTRFAMLRHMMKWPVMLFIMLGVMAAIMVAIMTMMR